MSQTTECNVNYVCHFSIYCCRCTLCIRSMNRRKVNRMENLHWCTQIKIFCHLSICNKQKKVKKSSTTNHLVYSLLSEVLTIEIRTHLLGLLSAMYYLFISNLSHDSRNHNSLRHSSQLWHYLVVFYALPFIACHYFNILVPPFRYSPSALIAIDEAAMGGVKLWVRWVRCTLIWTRWWADVWLPLSAACL